MKWLLNIIILIAVLPVSAQTLQDKYRVIFLKETPVLFEQLLPDSNLQRFTPSPAEIDSADRYLMTPLTHDTPADRSPSALNLYYRQYAGFLRDGTKYIFVNAACRKPDYFTKNTFYPKGGGNCYFRALVNLELGSVEQLLINAPR